MPVPIGKTTIAGYSATLAAVAAAVVAFVTGDHSQQTLGTIVGAAFAGLSFAITQAGRYAQAHKLISAADIKALEAVTLHVDPLGVETVADPDLLPGVAVAVSHEQDVVGVQPNPSVPAA